MVSTSLSLASKAGKVHRSFTGRPFSRYSMTSSSDSILATGSGKDHVQKPQEAAVLDEAS